MAHLHGTPLKHCKLPAHAKMCQGRAAFHLLKVDDTPNFRYGSDVMNEPLLSVIVPSRNRHQELGRALDSIAIQGWGERLEVVVVDDGSTPAVSIEPRNDLPILQVIRNDEPAGAAAARNKGVSLSAGSHIAFLDDDDEWLPEKLDVQWEMLQNSGADFCYGGLEFITEGAGPYAVIIPPSDPSSLINDMLIRDVMGFPSLIITRSIFDKVGGMDERFGAVNDYDFCLRLALEGRGIPLCRIVVRAFRRPERPSLTGNLELHLQGRRLFLEKHADLLATRSDAVARHLIQIGQTLASSGRRREARQEFRSALRSGGIFFTSLFHLLAVNLPLTLYRAMGELAWRIKGGGHYR